MAKKAVKRVKTLSTVIEVDEGKYTVYESYALVKRKIREGDFIEVTDQTSKHYLNRMDIKHVYPIV